MGCLKNLVITSVGDVGYRPEQLRKWVEANSGRWVTTVTKNLTHLICSKECWKRGNEAVTAAQKLDKAHIVTYDWLEDSLYKKRRLSEKKYLWEKVDKERKKKKQMRRVADKHDRMKFAKGCANAVEDVGSGESTSASRKSSAPQSFFRSSLAELMERREARAKAEAEARAKHEAQLLSNVDAADNKIDASQGNTRKSGYRELQMSDVEESHTPAEEKEKNKEEEEPKPVAMDTHGGERKAVDQKVLGQVEREENFSSASPSKHRSPAPATISAAHPVKSPNTSPHPSSLALPSSAVSATTFIGPIPPAAPPTAQTPSPPRAEKLTDNYHIYLDKTGFHYDINLIRINMPRNAVAKYNLRLFESHTKPHVYCTFVRYTPAPERAPRADGVARTASGVLVLVGVLNEELGKGKGKIKGTVKKDGFGAGHGRPNTVANASTANITAITRTDTGSNNNPTITNGNALPSTSTPATSPTTPYRNLIAPLHSDFPTAFMAFTAAFQELTFLPWESRLMPQAREIQKSRARAAGLEPFLYISPLAGLPAGIVPAVPVLSNQTGSAANKGKFDVADVKKFDLPGMDVKISREYSLGGEIFREDEKRRREIERLEIERREIEKKKEMDKKEAKAKARRERSARPFFGGQRGDGYL